MIFKEIQYEGERLTNEGAVKLVQRAMRYDSDITLESGLRKMNGKSLMGVISLGLKRGDKITVIANGDDERTAADDVAATLSRAQ